MKGTRLGCALSWSLLSVLLIWNVLVFARLNQKLEVAIPYSAFVAQVRKSNVSEVRIAGDRISGTFVKPFSAPNAPKEQFSTFGTTFPATLGDRELMPLLQARNVVVNAEPASGSWFGSLLANWLPWFLIIGLAWWLMRSGGQSRDGLLNRFTTLDLRRYGSNGRPRITMRDVAGVEEAKAELQEEVDFLRNPRKYHDLGARIPRGVLLVGAPGTGKTLLARAVAGEADVPFFSLNASEFVEMFVGVGAGRVRDLFRQAKEAAPAIVFIDELDAVGRRRGAGVGMVNDEREQTLNQLLGEMDGFDQRFDVIILAATNRPDVLDPALLRPGRFDRQVVIELPDRRAREAILSLHAGKLKLEPDVDLAALAKMTIGLSGADLENLCNEAALAAARRDRTSVSMENFEEAQDRLRLGVARPALVDPTERKIIAYHEAGHALVAWFIPEADPVHKVTIIPHGQALGQTEQLPSDDRHNLSFSYLKAKLAVMLAGRAAEEIVFGDVTTGAENDLVEATQLARQMVTRWGMGELGVFALRSDAQQPFLGYELAQEREYSEVTAACIDRNVRSLLDQAHEEVRKLLSGELPRLDLLANALLREEVVGSDELLCILGQR